MERSQRESEQERARRRYWVRQREEAEDRRQRYICTDNRTYGKVGRNRRKLGEHQTGCRREGEGDRLTETNGVTERHKGIDSGVVGR